MATVRSIKLSSLFNIEAPEGFLTVRPPVGEGQKKIILPKSYRKEEIAERLISLYLHDGDLSGYPGLNKDFQAYFEGLFKQTADRAVEDRLREGLFTFWRNGTTFLVLKALEGAFGNIIVKFVRPEKEFDSHAKAGYQMAKDHLGPGISVAMRIVDVDLRVRDCEGIIRTVNLKNVLVQERAIVLKDILETYNEEFKRLRDVHRNLPLVQIQKLPEVVSLQEALVKVKKDFNHCYDEMEARGLEDKDEGRKAMDRNYGYRVPTGFVPTDWGLHDYLALRKHNYPLHVVGFDFDSIIQRRGAELKKDRVPDVFSMHIRKYLGELLARILVVRD